MTDQADFDETFEDHCIYLIIYQLYVHDRVCHSKILNWRVHGNVEAVELNHFLQAPNANLAIK